MAAKGTEVKRNKKQEGVTIDIAPLIKARNYHPLHQGH